MLAHTLAQQAKRPAGWLGRLFGLGMSRVNQGVNEWVVSLLDLKNEKCVLEVGFGPGRAIECVAAQLERGHVHGLDSSPLMVARAGQLNRAAIAAGKVTLCQGEADHLPYPDQSFDRLFCVNVAYFWPEPQRELAELFRVSKPDALLAIYLGDKAQMAQVPMTRTGLFTLYSPEDMLALLRAQGFVACQSFAAEISQGPISRGACVVGKRPLQG